MVRLIEDILSIPMFMSKAGTLVKLFLGDGEDLQTCKSIEEHYNSLYIFGNRPMVEVVEDEEEAVKRCDLLIFLEDFSR